MWSYLICHEGYLFPFLSPKASVCCPLLHITLAALYSHHRWMPQVLRESVESVSWFQFVGLLCRQPRPVPSSKIHLLTQAPRNETVLHLTKCARYASTRKQTKDFRENTATAMCSLETVKKTIALLLKEKYSMFPYHWCNRLSRRYLRILN